MLKFGKIRISSRTVGILANLKSTTGLQSSTLARFSFCLSLRQQDIPNPDEYNKAGSELSPGALFGEHMRVYLSLMQTRLRNDRLDPEHYIDEMTRAHINRGAISLKQRINSLSDFYGLVVNNV